MLMAAEFCGALLALAVFSSATSEFPREECVILPTIAATGPALLQAQAKLQAKAEPQVPANATAWSEVDEPESAPAWYMTLAIIAGAAVFILSVMLLILSGLQVLVKKQQRYQESLVETGKAKNVKGAKAGGLEAEKSDLTPKGLGAEEVMALINGDQERLQMLLDFAQGDAQERLEGLVKKSMKAYKVSLSKSSEAQIAEGVMALAKSVQSMQNAKLRPKERLQKAMRQVRSMVRTCRALKIPIGEHEEQQITKEEEEAVKRKHAEGAKQGPQRNVKIMTETSNSWLASYFASEKWLDHAGIGIIIFYSQFCGIVYATYLKLRFPKMYEFMGPWVLVSRGEAMSIIVLSCMMVLLMTRGFITWCHNICKWSTILQNMVEKHALMHQWCGILLPVCAVLHVLGHFKGSIPAIINETDEKKINEVFTYGTKIKFNFNTWHGALACYPAITGYVLIVLLIAFWSFSNEWVRRKNFELFHYPHLLLIVAWAAGLWAHGARQWLGCGVPLGLLCVVPLTVYYFGERIYYIWQGTHTDIKIANAIIKKKSVLLEIETSGKFVYDTGMYCMLKVPAVSALQWHPFTIASASGASKVQVLFALAGDWTTRFKELLAEAQKSRSPYPEICLRGGYGAPAQNIQDEKHVVMVGAGVGATPFLSFLATICDGEQKGPSSKFQKLESAVFYWLSREPEDFVWVNKYNSIIAATPSLKNRVSVRLVLTKGMETSETNECSAAEAALFWIGVQVALRLDSQSVVQELGAPTQFGRPNWKKELGDRYKELVKYQKKGEKMEIGVYACGNNMLVQSLEDACDSLDSDEVDFKLFAEQF